MQSYNAFAVTVPGLIAKDRAGLDPAERPEPGAVGAALPLLEMAAQDRKVFDDSPFELKQDFRADLPATGPEERDQTEDLYSLLNLMVVMTAVAHAETKQADPKPAVEATKPGKEPTEFSKGFWATAGAGGFTGGTIGAAVAVKAYHVELLAFATKMPGTQFLVELINLIVRVMP